MSLESLTKLKLSIDIMKDNVLVDRLVLDGKVEMTQPEQDAYKRLMGDEGASVTAGREVSEMHFGSGGKVFASITLTVDQSTEGIETGYAWANHFVDKKIWEAHAELKAQLLQHGILKDG